MRFVAICERQVYFLSDGHPSSKYWLINDICFLGPNGRDGGKYGVEPIGGNFSASAGSERFMPPRLFLVFVEVAAFEFLPCIRVLAGL